VYKYRPWIIIIIIVLVAWTLSRVSLSQVILLTNNQTLMKT